MSFCKRGIETNCSIEIPAGKMHIDKSSYTIFHFVNWLFNLGIQIQCPGRRQTETIFKESQGFKIIIESALPNPALAQKNKPSSFQGTTANRK